MRVSEFYGSACPTRSVLQKFSNSPVHAESTALRALLKSLADGMSYDTALAGFSKSLASDLSSCDFPFEWQREQRLSDDIGCVRRFLDYIRNQRILASSVEVNACGFETAADLITADKGFCHAYVIRWHQADKSPGGKSVSTNVSTDLNALVVKAGLEETYPKVKVDMVYLRNSNDTAGKLTDFIVARTKKSNIFTLSYDEFYTEGVWDSKAVGDEIKRVSSVPLTPDCFSCSYKGACTANTVANTAPVQERPENSESQWQMPDRFTDAQQSVINLVDGPAVICAGPGSGKTATLVGRIRHLIQDVGIDPEFILAITFTKDAAGELLSRCRTFCEPDSMPEIMTLNAFGYMILNRNPDYSGGQRRLLGKRERQKLIKTLLDATGPIQGFGSTQLYGQTGLLATLDRRLTEYEQSPDEYLMKNPQLKDDFKVFAGSFKRAVSEHGYISYDEQITLATELLKSHPEVLGPVSARYKYIMVDEFQDIDRAQAELIYLISGNRNLVVVGDDDQSIYGFRGGSNRYMLEFDKNFPEAKKIVLSENFRSTENLVDNASGFISRNKRRISKEVRSVRGKGMAPVIRKGRQPDDVKKAVSELLAKGYGMSDIVVLATKNATLEDISRKVDFPSVLGKSFLIESPLFKCLHDTLCLAEGYDDGRYLDILLTLGLPLAEVPVRGMLGIFKHPEEQQGTLRQAGVKVSSWVSLVNRGCSVSALIDTVASNIGFAGSADVKALYDLLESRRDVRDIRSLHELMADMVNFGDETRLEPDTSNAVLFITSHESKGMEWRAVVLVDDFKDDGSEETNRLYYVAMTRAKDALYILTEGEKTLLNAV